MEFEILVFRNPRELEKFVIASDKVIVKGISRRTLSRKILLIWKKATVKPEEWGQYCSAGFCSVCGDWVPVWHETKSLHYRFSATLKKNGVPFVEIFRGSNVITACPEGEINNVEEETFS